VVFGLKLVCLLTAERNAPLTGTTVAVCTILFNQPDFVSQKSELQEFVERCGHLCDFYPKYHCELNFIEQYWGAAKLHFRTAGQGATLDAMKKKVLDCLDDIPVNQICRCVQALFVLIIPFFLTFLLNF
jgi:hypothetical protein